MPKEYFFLYLTYGLVYLIMGFKSLLYKNEEVNNLPLVKVLPYLGLFGILHGLSEWITMIVITNLYQELYEALFFIKQFLKALSFAFLMAFGTALLPSHWKYKRNIRVIPWILFGIWLIGFFSLYWIYDGQYHLDYPYFNIIVLRYCMGLSAGMLTGYAIFYQSKQMKKRNLLDIALKYKRLAYIFVAYGIVDGLIVREMDFFPANVINNEAFKILFGFPIQVIKIAVGIVITVLLIKVIETFSWEQKEKIKALERRKIADEERRKLGIEIHDSIIQSIYAANLKIDFLSQNVEEPLDLELLTSVKEDLGETISRTRDFIKETAQQTIFFEELVQKINQQVRVFNKSQHIQLAVESDLKSKQTIELSVEKSSQIYYIIQEAIMNILKHSQANQATISLIALDECLQVSISDDGIGFDENTIDQHESYGIGFMKERVEVINGLMTFKRQKKGTVLDIRVPWESE